MTHHTQTQQESANLLVVSHLLDSSRLSPWCHGFGLKGLIQSWTSRTHQLIKHLRYLGLVVSTLVAASNLIAEGT